MMIVVVLGLLVPHCIDLRSSLRRGLENMEGIVLGPSRALIVVRGCYVIEDVVPGFELTLPVNMWAACVGF
jgi:hypothetical protein